MNLNSRAPASWKIRFSRRLSLTRLVTTMPLRSNTLSTSDLIRSSTAAIIRGDSCWTRSITSRRTRTGSDSQSPGR